MPNVYKRRPGARKYADYNEAQLEKALAEVAQGNLSIRGAAEKYSIPKSTIFGKYRGQHHRKYGGQTVLSEADEQKIVEGLLLAAEWGFPLNQLELRHIVKRYLDSKGVREKRFTHNLPGRVWLQSFLHRHRDVLSRRLSENIKRSGQQYHEK